MGVRCEHLQYQDQVENRLGAGDAASAPGRPGELLAVEFCKKKYGDHVIKLTEKLKTMILSCQTFIVLLGEQI